MIEVPSGLIDAGETPSQCAVRELKEETGYVGVADVTYTNAPVMFNGKFVTVSMSIGRFAPWIEAHICYFAPISSLNADFDITIDPGFCNTNTKMIHVKVDMSLPENQNLKTDLEENEFIETFSLPLKTLWQDLCKMDAEGYAIDARVGTFAEGFELGRRYKDL